MNWLRHDFSLRSMKECPGASRLRAFIMPPHPSRLRRATFPSKGKAFGDGFLPPPFGCAKWGRWHFCLGKNDGRGGNPPLLPPLHKGGFLAPDRRGRRPRRPARPLLSIGRAAFPLLSSRPSEASGGIWERCNLPKRFLHSVAAAPSVEMTGERSPWASSVEMTKGGGRLGLPRSK